MEINKIKCSKSLVVIKALAILWEFPVPQPLVIASPGTTCDFCLIGRESLKACS